MRVAVFAKAPVAGEVKTRLIPRMGAEAATRLHGALVEHALRVATAAGVGPVELHGTPDARHPFFLDCSRAFGVALEAQRGADLGARMRNAFEAAFERGEALIVIGADCPALSAAHIREAREALRVDDAVLIPAEDGGYVLIALSRRIEGIFDGIAWGSAEVLEGTREAFQRAGARVRELATLWDVDRPEDLERMEREGLLGEAGA